MNPAAKSSAPEDNLFVPLARIDAQEESFVIPIREYLEINGCRVILGSTLSEEVTYHIVAGDVNFVKQIFSTLKIKRVRTLGILVGSSFSDAKTLVTENRKIIIVDPVALTHDGIVEIFSYFFSGNDEVSDKRRNRHAENNAKTEGSETINRTREEKKTGRENIEYIKPNEENTIDKKRIESLIIDVFGSKSSNTKQKKIERHHKKKKSPQQIVGRMISVIFFCCLPIAWYMASVVISGVSFGLAADKLYVGDVGFATRLERIGSYWLRHSMVSFGVFRVPLDLAGQTTIVRGQERLLSFFQDMHTAFIETERIMMMGNDVTKLVLSNGLQQTNQSPAAVLDRLRVGVSSLGATLGLAQAQLAALLADQSFPFFLSPAKKKGESVLSTLTSIRQMVSFGDSFLLLYPLLAGFDEPKTYLVLLQNSAELRPTGGFIGSIGKLTFEDGMMRDFTVQDVYAVDGQLKGHVDPPKPIRELLNQEHWYLRDSNWDPDFQASGQKAAWFYQKETGETVDGVIALSLPLVVDILRVTGPIILADYNDQITADNFLGKSIYYTKDNFFPGSTAKADFLGTLARTLLLRLTTDTHTNPLKLFKVITEGIERRDIQFMFIDPKQQQLVESLGWSGTMLRQKGCSTVNQDVCLFAPFAVNEANVSISKVNAFIKHDNNRELVISSDGTISETSTLTVTNTAANNEPGVGGAYRTYIRFYFPTDASILDVMLDGVTIQASSAKKVDVQRFPYVEQVEAPVGAQGIGIAMEVDPGTNRRVRISYTRGIKLPIFSGETTLDIWHYKQAGLTDVAQRIVIYYPVFWKAESISRENPVVAKDGVLEYNTILSRDLIIRLRFTK